MKDYYRVTQGSYRRWFDSQKKAKEFAEDRCEREFDGIPWIEQFEEDQILLKLNELEARVAGEAAMRHAPA